MLGRIGHDQQLPVAIGLIVQCAKGGRNLFRNDRALCREQQAEVRTTLQSVQHVLVEIDFRARYMAADGRVVLDVLTFLHIDPEFGIELSHRPLPSAATECRGHRFPAHVAASEI